MEPIKRFSQIRSKSFTDRIIEQYYYAPPGITAYNQSSIGGSMITINDVVNHTLGYMGRIQELEKQNSELIKANSEQAVKIAQLEKRLVPPPPGKENPPVTGIADTKPSDDPAKIKH